MAERDRIPLDASSEGYTVQFLENVESGSSVSAEVVDVRPDEGVALTEVRYEC